MSIARELSKQPFNKAQKQAEIFTIILEEEGGVLYYNFNDGSCLVIHPDEEEHYAYGSNIN